MCNSLFDYIRKVVLLQCITESKSLFLKLTPKTESRLDCELCYLLEMSTNTNCRTVLKLSVTVSCVPAGAQRLLNNNNEVTLNARQILDQLNRAKEVPCILLPKETEETEKIRLADCHV